MKPTTQNVLNFLQSDNFNNLISLKEKIVSYGWLKYEYQEMTLEEAYYKLDEIINILNTSINNNDFDKLVNYSERQSVLSVFQNLNNCILNLKSGANQINNFISYIQSLENIIFKIENSIKGYPNYQEKLKNVSYLKSRYEEMILKLESSHGLFENLTKYVSEGEKNLLDSNKTLENIKNIETQINSIKENVNQQNSDINEMYNRLSGVEAEANSKKDSIVIFSNHIDKYKATIEDKTKFINDFIENTRKEFNNLISKNSESTKKIITENEDLQRTIKDILGKAVGTNLYKSFDKKSKWMLGQSAFWLILLLGSLYFLSDSGKYIFESLKPLFESGKITDLTLTFYLRLTLIFPAIYAVYFTASEFKNTNKLREEYDFKSSVAVALHHFKDLVNDAKEDKEGTQKFLIDSTEKIFMSPTDKVFGKKSDEKDINNKAKEIVSDIANITSDIANKILPNK